MDKPKTINRCNIREGMCTIHNDEAICIHHCSNQRCGCRVYKSYEKKHGVQKIKNENDFEDGEEDEGAKDPTNGGGEQGDEDVDEDFDTAAGIGPEESNMDPADRAKLYILSLTVLSEEWKSSGESFMDAISKLEIGNLKARGRWTLYHDGMKSEVFMLPPIIKKTLANKTFQEILQKRMVTTLH